MIQIVTAHPLAAHSYDHLHPKGTKQDNTHAPQFVAAVERIFERTVAACDLGCAGGGLVKDFMDAGHSAVGVEGSDYSLKAGRAEWATIPERLFTADITKPFHFCYAGDPWRFDVITAWEVLEHIAREDVPAVLANVHSNLETGGLFVASIAQFEDERYHVTLESENWWTAQFLMAGLTVAGGFFRPGEYARQSSLYLTGVKC